MPRNHINRLCIDNSKYIGDGQAMSLDPVGCIIQDEKTGLITIDREREILLSEQQIDDIIAADPAGAFHRCDTFTF